MAFLGGCLAVGKAAPMFGPVGLLVGAAALTLGAAVFLAAANKKKPPHRKQQPTPVLNQQRDGFIDSSEVEDLFHLGVNGFYAALLENERPFSKDKEYRNHVEADHIPPIASLKMAKSCPGFGSLKDKNPVLHRMVILALNGEKGHLFAIQVAKQHHRVALSTGNSHESHAARLVVARYIARGEAMAMLKAAMIIAHPIASVTIRDFAELSSYSPDIKILFKLKRIMSYYKNSFHGAVNHYYREQKILNDEEYKELMDWVNDEGYLDRSSSEYMEILEAVTDTNRKKTK